MPPQDSKPLNTSSIPSVGQTGDKELREDWKKLSPEDQDSYFKSLPSDKQDEFAHRVGLFDSQAPISVGAPPEADWKDMLSGSPAATGVGIARSIPWMKEKALGIVNWGANQLPTAGGVGFGVAGGAIGEAVAPTGGGLPGSIIGSGIGGAVGEGARQYLQHKTGIDKYEDPKTMGDRFSDMGREGLWQAAGEASGHLMGKWLRPTLERSIAKLYYAGNLKYGDPEGPGALETVIHDAMGTENSGLGKSVTVRDFLSVLRQGKNEIGQKVDLQMALPITQNGQTMMLGHAHADSTSIANAITAKATADPSVVKMAKLNPAGKEAAYLERLRQEALNFSKSQWTYIELTDRRIKLNNELAPVYELPPGEQRVYLLDHPDLAYKKAEADAIRDVVYPKMDLLAGNPMGTTAELQNKRGAYMSLENQVTEHLSDLKTKARRAKGAPVTEKANISTYGTSSGKPGIAMHRLSSIVHTPNPERTADTQVKKAFGHGVGTNIRRVITTPGGSEKWGNEILSMPLRELVNPSQPKPPEQNDTPEPQSSVVRPKDLIDKAKQMNPATQGQVAYNHVAVNPATGHRIGSKDGRTWFDLVSGAKVA